MWRGLVLCVSLCLGVLGEGREERQVRTPQGVVKGYKEPGDSIFAFYGIPYATAPTGKHKFQAPLPAPTWSKPFDAVDSSIICHQAVINNLSFPEMIRHENCLIANVYVPDTDQKTLPVLVYVHGGAYQIGHSNFVLLKNFARSKKVILVTFNYRVGIYGFLCLGTDLVPGNAGMKDQVELLRWVKRHISSYGGDPDDVTIAGFSAGSSAVDLLMLSPATQGLFNKVIPESGANLASWSVQPNPMEYAKAFAKTQGVENVDDVYALEEFYTSASFDVLNSDSLLDRTDFSFGFSPCVERDTQEAFLTESPFAILKSGKYQKVPMLYGFAEMEGLMRIDKFEEWKDKMNANFSAFLPLDLKFESDVEKEAVTKKVKEFYFGKKPINEESIFGYINFMSDLYFAYSTLRAVNLHVKAGQDKIYLYEYSFVDDSTPIIPHTKDVRGANHCDQTAALSDARFVTDKSNSSHSEEFENMKIIMKEIWLNFITTGSPVPAGSPLPAWPATGAGGSPHMSLGRTLQLRGPLLEHRVRFWDDIYEKHYREPQPPPTPPARHSDL